MRDTLNVTEMDATARILVIVNEILRELPESVHVQLQPSHENHPVFTDFFLFTSRNTPLLLIEVKELAITTLLTAATQTTAQVLREVHIALDKVPIDVKLPFVLTNGAHWSFGIANRVGNKINVISLGTRLSAR